MKAPRIVKGEEAPPESDRRPGVLHPREQTALFGHARAEQALLDAYRADRLPHALIVGGREGIGKATFAWRLARFLAANPDPQTTAVRDATSLFVPPDHRAAREIAALSAPNIVALRREWNPVSRPAKHFGVIRVDEVRAATRRFHLAAVGGGWRVAIIDTADDLNTQAANALLKMIEEPPRRSLFVLVSNQPGRLLPTIRSRCRRLMLEPLAGADLAAALGSIGMRADAAILERARGSVAEALRLIAGPGARATREIEALLARAPAIDWREAAGLADRLGAPRAEAEWDAFVEIVFRFLDEEVRRRAGEGAGRLAPLARVWERFEDGVRTTEALNLDKRALILSLFEDLGSATGDARS